VLILKSAPGRVDVLAFSPDSKRLVAPSDRGLQVWNEITDGGRPSFVLNPPGTTSVEFTPDGTWLLLGKFLVVHNLERAYADGIPGELEESRSHWASLTPDGRAVVVAQEGRANEGGQVFRRPLDSLISTNWSVAALNQPLSRPLFLTGDRFVTFERWIDRPDVRALNPGPVYVTRDAKTGATLSEVRSTGQAYVEPVILADRRWIAARWRTWIAVFHADDFLAKPATIRNDNRKDFTGLAFHPSGRFLAATSNDATVKLYDTTSWKMVHAFDWDIGRLRSITFSPDGMLAAAGGDKGKIVVWDFDL
jgi:WD40 repeat protein